MQQPGEKRCCPDEAPHRHPYVPASSHADPMAASWSSTARVSRERLKAVCTDEDGEDSCRVRKVISALREGLPQVKGSVVRLSQSSGSTRRDEPAPWASRDQ